MDKLRSVLAVAALALPAFSAHAQAADPLQVRSWAGACANCHGTNGNAQAGNEPLAGMNRDDMVQ
ncbi:MAG: class I cytochrome c, partial [Ramlibacter sp.]